jgi:hypothetical protein
MCSTKITKIRTVAAVICERQKAGNLIKLDARSISHNAFRLPATLLKQNHCAYRVCIKSWDLNHNKEGKSRSFSLLAIVEGKNFICFFLLAHDINIVVCCSTFKRVEENYLYQYSTIRRLIMSLQKKIRGERETTPC